MHLASKLGPKPNAMHTASNKRDAYGIKNWDQSSTRCTRHQTNATHTASKLGPKPNAMHTASNKRDAHGIKRGPMPNVMHTASNKRDAHGIKQTRCIQHQITALKSTKNCHAPGHKIHGTNYAHNDAQAKQLVTSDTIQREPRPTLHRHLGQHMTKLHSYLLQNSDTCRMGTRN